MTSASPSSRYRWWQVTLVLFLLATMVVSVPLAWRAMERSRQRQELMTMLARLGNTPQLVPGDELAIREALQRKTPIEYEDVPLSQVCEDLRREYSIPVQLDTVGLNGLPPGGEQRVTAHLEEMPLKSALRHMLRPLDLTYVVQGEVLLITTPQRAAAESVVRIYNVADIIRKQPSAEQLAKTLKELYEDPARRGETTRPASSPAETGFPPAVRVTAYEKMLVVRAPRSVHDEICEMLPLLKDGLRRQAILD